MYLIYLFNNFSIYLFTYLFFCLIIHLNVELAAPSIIYVFILA